MRFTTYRDRKTLAAVVAQYLFSLSSIALTTVILYFFRDKLSTSTVALVFFLPVGASTAFWGLAPGIFAAASAFLSLNYFFLKPYYSFQVHQTQDLLVLIIFLFVAIIINYLVGRTQASLSEAMTRERETTWLYELSTAIAGLSDQGAIARVLAEKTQVTFQAGCAQVSLEPSASIPAIVIRYPENFSISEQDPTWVVPLQTIRGLLGEICLWRGADALTPSEERLIQTYASQGALALERANLAQSERRAHILEESDRLKSVLLSSVSHELRTPLATIKAAVSSLLSDEVIWDSESRHDLLNAIEEETDHLNYLVGNLLDMSRIESGAYKPQLRWNVFSEIVSSAISQVRSISKNHTIIDEVSADLPLVPVDYVQMERVLTNLLSNSVKFSPEHTEIHIRAWVKDDRTLQIQVTNQGPQVPEEHLERIFDKFNRVTTANKVMGTGLGLSICKGFVESHGGRIWAQNLPDGLAFNFTLPLTKQGETPLLPVEL